MSKISCHLRLGAVPLHLYQIIAGFHLLMKQGIIDLKVSKLSKREALALPSNMMEVIVNDAVRVLYDVNDGYDNLLGPGEDYASWMDGILANYDYCFKRSFSSEYNARLHHGGKLWPLGLNYMVTVPGNTAHHPMPAESKRDRLKKLARMLPFLTNYNGRNYPNVFEDMPRQEPYPRILFMARLWNAAGDYEGQLTTAKQEERAHINEVRAQCIRMCREAFGEQFFGGLAPTAYALEQYPDLVIPDVAIVRRSAYIKRVQESAICIATTGLHESIGWKFAEYVAASRAIVTEPLRYEVPGNLQEGEHYLSFNTPEECVTHIARLAQDHEFRHRMMVRNFEYYHNFVRADRLVLNSLIRVLE